MIQQQPVQQQQPVLTPEAYQLVTNYNLGTPVAIYRPKFTTSKIISVVLLFVIGLACIAGSISSADSAALLIAGLILVAFGLVIPGSAFLTREKRVYVCPAGLLYQQSGKADAIRWDQIDATWQRVIRRYSYGIHTGTTHLYTVRRNDGATFKFNDQLYNVEALGNTIARETTRLLLPRYIAAYSAGQTLNFGQISVNQQGVSNGQELLPWYQIKAIQVNRGVISIQKEGKWLNWKTVQAARTPNVHVFMALVNYIVNGGKR